MNVSRFNPWDLRDQNYLITGAASGIGRAIALLFDQLGAKLVLVDKNRDGLESTVEACVGIGHVCFPFDLSNLEGVPGLVDDAVARVGHLNGLAHAAGIQNVVPLRGLNRDDWQGIFRVNTESALALAKATTGRKALAQAGGSIVFVSSIMALAGTPGAAAYSMSKAALLGLARSLAVELAPRRVRVNCIVPGFVRTPMFEQTERLWDEGMRRAVEAMHPLGFGMPEDVANAAGFLCCETGRWVTGSSLIVDGGYLAR